jgi:peptide deformylase
MFTIERPSKDSGLGIYAKSVAVKPKEYKQLAADMCKWLDETNGHFKGSFQRGFAIAHCQVANVPEPIKLFVLDKDLVVPEGKEPKGKQTLVNCFFEAQAIFNAEILEAPDKITKQIPRRKVTHPKDKPLEVQVEVVYEPKEVDNRIMVPEACMSFNEHNRKERNTQRFHTIKVRYQYLSKNMLGIETVKTFKGWVEGLKAHILQHEVDHHEGRNMYGK